MEWEVCSCLSFSLSTWKPCWCLGKELSIPRSAVSSWLGVALALCWRQGPVPASSEGGLWQEVWARLKLAALDPGGDCATPLVLSALALSSQQEQGRAWERPLLTSPGTVPDGWVVIYISWNPVHLPELLRGYGCLLLLSFQSLGWWGPVVLPALWDGSVEQGL